MRDRKRNKITKRKKNKDNLSFYERGKKEEPQFIILRLRGTMKYIVKIERKQF